MLRGMVHILRGIVQWKILQIRYGINHKKVVIFLTGDNPILDYYALLHLKDFMDRKYVERAVIFLDGDYYRRFWGGNRICQKAYRTARETWAPDSVRWCGYPAKKAKVLYDYYAFYKFSSKIVFTYTDRPKDNQLGRVLRETEISEEDAVCLGLYHLRTVPRVKDSAAGTALDSLLTEI